MLLRCCYDRQKDARSQRGLACQRVRMNKSPGNVAFEAFKWNLFSLMTDLQTVPLITSLIYHFVLTSLEAKNQQMFGILAEQ